MLTLNLENRIEIHVFRGVVAQNTYSAVASERCFLLHMTASRGLGWLRNLRKLLLEHVLLLTSLSVIVHLLRSGVLHGELQLFFRVELQNA